MFIAVILVRQISPKRGPLSDSKIRISVRLTFPVDDDGAVEGQDSTKAATKQGREEVQNGSSLCSIALEDCTIRQLSFQRCMKEYARYHAVGALHHQRPVRMQMAPSALSCLNQPLLTPLKGGPAVRNQ